MRTVERAGGRGPRVTDMRTGPRRRGRGPTREDKAQHVRKGPTRHGQGPPRADGRTGGQAVGRTGGLGGRRQKSRGRVDWADGRTGSPMVGRTGGLGRTSVLAVRWSGGRADKRTDGRAGGPRFKRPHSMKLGSLLGAQSACLVRARVSRVPMSAVGSSTIPRQTPVLSARTHLPRLNASVLRAKKGILLF